MAECFPEKLVTWRSLSRSEV